jgi:hypothetical protein
LVIATELKGLHNSKLFPDEFKRDIRYFLKYNLDRNEYTINETVIKTKSNVIKTC